MLRGFLTVKISVVSQRYLNKFSWFGSLSNSELVSV